MMNRKRYKDLVWSAEYGGVWRNSAGDDDHKNDENEWRFGLRVYFLYDLGLQLQIKFNLHKPTEWVILFVRLHVLFVPESASLISCCVMFSWALKSLLPFAWFHSISRRPPLFLVECSSALCTRLFAVQNLYCRRIRCVLQVLDTTQLVVVWSSTQHIDRALQELCDPDTA